MPAKSHNASLFHFSTTDWVHVWIFHTALHTWNAMHTPTNLQSLLSWLAKTLYILRLAHTEKMLWHKLIAASEKSGKMHNFTWPWNTAVPRGAQGRFSPATCKARWTNTKELSAYAWTTHCMLSHIEKQKPYSKQVCLKPSLAWSFMVHRQNLALHWKQPAQRILNLSLAQTQTWHRSKNCMILQPTMPWSLWRE